MAAMFPTRAVVCTAILAAPLFRGATAQDWAALHRQHDGGTLRLSADSSFGTIDPQVNYLSKGSEIFYVLYDQLITVRRADNDDGTDLVPDLAQSMPQMLDGGKTYIFHLRQNIRFSNGHELTPRDVVASFERLFKVQNPNSGSWYNIIVGGDACVTHPQGCTLSDGVIGDDAARTVTFHLTRADGEFLYKLSFPFSSILPADTPTHDMGTTAPAGTGAYRVDHYDPTRGLTLSRNPFFREFNVSAQPRGFVDAIDYRFGLSNEAEVTAIINDQIDWMYETKPLDRLTDLGAHYASRMHIGEVPEIYYMPLNTRLDPFDSPQARLAVAYAVDRRAVAKLFGGTHMAHPFCQVLPHGIPGHDPYCPFTLDPGAAWTAPDMARARALMQASGKIGHSVTVIVEDSANFKAIGEYLRSMLQDLGFDARMKTVSSQIQFHYIQNTNNKVQASLTDWTADYPAPSDYLDVLFSCDSFHPGSDNSVNMAGYCNPALDARMKDALKIALTDPAVADRQWALIDRVITDAAACVVLVQVTDPVLVSSRIGNYTWSDIMHMMFAKVWVR